MACDLPTGPPTWDTTWVVATDSTLMSVRILLPGPVTVTDDSTSFLLEIEDTTVNRSLGELCGQPCRNADNTTAPKPAFTGIVYDTLGLHGDLSGFEAGAGQLRLRLSHGFGFDPIRPDGGGTGRVVVTVRSADRVLGTLIMDGDTMTFPAGALRGGAVALAGERIGRRLELETRVESPAGGPAAIDADAVLAIEPVLDSVTGDRATIRVRKEVSIEQAEMDFRDVDSTVVRHLRAGGLRLGIDNPWPIQGELILRIRTPTRNITKTFGLDEGVTETRVEVTEAELQAIVGSLVTFDAAGFAADGGQPFEVEPDEYLVIYPKVEAVVRVGEVEP